VTDRILIRGGCVLTLGARTPNFAQADVLIEDGKVAEVGPGLRARDADEVDATDTIVMPGFVDTHRHAWRSLFRNLGDDAQAAAGVDHYRPDDVYAATLVGLLGALEAGITTVVDWADIPVDERTAEAALQAHADAGVRTVFVHEDPDRFAERAGPPTTLAAGWGAGGGAEPDGAPEAWSRARDRGHRIHVHAGPGTAGLVGALAARALLGPDVVLAHGASLDDAALEAVASSGASVALAPSSDMATGQGPPPVQQLIDRGIRPGLGVDDERVAPGDLFAQMRATISMQHATVFDRKLAGKAGLPRLMSTRDVIRYATSDGARVAGLGDVTGSLAVGKHADVIVLRTDRPNIFPVNDPIGAVVWGMDTSNLDWVFAGGRALMRQGKLEADVVRARELATAAQHRVAVASGLVAAAPGGEA
jgi:5-methylthioadenosine/S-adenosylhomocysteine deaminase